MNEKKINNIKILRLVIYLKWLLDQKIQGHSLDDLSLIGLFLHLHLQYKVTLPASSNVFGIIKRLNISPYRSILILIKLLIAKNYSSKSFFRIISDLIF